MAERYLCVHGHFYQPPRENPWLERIELQDSAYPYHDWNERITAECYGPNARSRILNGENRIVHIINNYSRMSFNFGPTLLKWLADEEPEVYEAVLEADRQSMERFSGHGSALAQPWGHMILPLSNSRDKRTQIIWGIRDFEYRFRRRPEGMWLPETAVDLESLEIMAQLGIRFTILSTHQAARVRRTGRGPWKDVGGGQIDPTRGYLIRLESGRRMNLFFYDGPISRSVAFEGLLSSGENFANRLATGFSDQRSWPQLVNIATDGESYGHHHRFGDMALAYTLEHVQNNSMARLTNYAEYLERHPPQHEIQVLENTSWSCGHGIERWRNDCGCNTGGQPGWNQSWREPLREALDWLRDEIAPRYEEKARELLRDPWDARNDYMNVILHRRDNQDAFFEKHAWRPLSEGETIRALKLLELQRHAMLMFTSCGWFFDELSGIETMQVIEYAGRAIQLATELLGVDVEGGFLERLERARSNIPEHQNGRVIYQRFVKPSIVELVDVGAHYAVSSLFESYEERQGIYCYMVDVEDYRLSTAGEARLAVGRIKLTSEITLDSQTVSFAVLHFGDHNITAGVRPHAGVEAYAEMTREIEGAFSRMDIPSVIRALDHHFGEWVYSLKSLFRDEQRKILDLILEGSLQEAEATYRQIHEHHAPLMRFLQDVGFPMPRAFRAAAEEVVNANLRRVLADEGVELDKVQGYLRDAQSWQAPLDEVGLAYTFQRTVATIAHRFRENPTSPDVLDRLSALVAIAGSLPFKVNLWDVQNHYWHVLKNNYPELSERANRGDEEAAGWVRTFLPLGAALHFRVE